LQRKAK
jgi:hypothetical protein